MFFNNCNWCRCWNRCKNKCSSNHCHKRDDDQCHSKKYCHIDRSIGYNDRGCCHKFDNYGMFENDGLLPDQCFDYNNYEYSNFKYYDQYGSFDRFDDNDIGCDKKSNTDNNDCHKHCKPSYDKCQPTKFVCFPVDRY